MPNRLERGGTTEYPDSTNRGAADIDISERKNGQWQAVRNAGPKMSTTNDEDCPNFRVSENVTVPLRLAPVGRSRRRPMAIATFC